MEDGINATGYAVVVEPTGHISGAARGGPRFPSRNQSILNVTSPDRNGARWGRMIVDDDVL